MVIFGLIFFIWGLVAFIRNRKFSKVKPVKGVVTACEKKDGIKGTGVQYFETEIEFTTVYGTLHRTVKGDQPYVVGTNLDVRFDAKGNKLQLEKTYRSKGKIYPITFMVMGLVTIVIDVILIVSKSYGVDEVPMIMGAGVLVIFTVLGFWLSFIRPFSRRKFIKKSDIVEGVLVDYIRAGYSNINDKHRSRTSNFSAIYEYTYGGITQRFRSSASGNGGIHTELGRKVSLAINNETGEVLCLEDDKGLTFVGIVFLLFGVIGAIVIYTMFMR